MAHNNIEVEIKIPLAQKKFLEIREKIREIAKFKKTSAQEDAYFTPAHRNFVAPKYPYEWLSIRRRAGKASLNYKHFYPENAEITTHCDEFETEINAKQMEKLFDSLNFKKLVTVKKQREVYLYNNEFEICLDAVDNLGFFIEIESLKDFGSPTATKKKLFEFAKQLGIDASKAELRGYPYLMMKKKGLLR